MPTRIILPIDYFPAKPRRDGRFAKRIRGQVVYFGGPGIGREEALREYHRVRNALYAGEEPAPTTGIEAVTIRDLANLYATERERDERAGSIKTVTYRQLHHALKVFLRFVGPGRRWDEITPADYSAYIRHLETTYGDYAYNHHLSHVTAFWNGAVAMGWIPARPNLGPKWKKKNPVRKAEPRALTGPEVKTLLKHLKPQLVGMLLLGLNGGMGPADCCALQWDEVGRGSISQRRGKTRRRGDIPRLIPLWAITSKVLSALPRVSDYVFTTQRGQPWNETSVAHDFAMAVEAGGIKLPPGYGLYLARHTFSTLADECLDVNGKRRIMGHALAGMDRHYVDQIGVERLRKITEHVRKRLGIPLHISKLI